MWITLRFFIYHSLLLFVIINSLAQHNTEIDLANEYYSKGELEKAKS